MRRWIALTTLALAAAPAGRATAQIDVSFETGLINFGPLVTEERENFVRFGSNDGLERFFAMKLSDGRWYARLAVAPTQVHVWSVQDTIHPTVGSRSDPRRSRWHYRPVGRARDSFVWSSVTGGIRTERGPFSGRAGAGLISLSQTDHAFWGASTGHVVTVEGAGAARWRGVGATCGGQLGFLGRFGTRWIVLEHAAGSGAQPGDRRPRTLRPLYCGFEIRIGAGGGGSRE